nr:hypothetical protein CFP56_38797 [Quercus suber]
MTGPLAFLASGKIIRASDAVVGGRRSAALGRGAGREGCRVLTCLGGRQLTLHQRPGSSSRQSMLCNRTLLQQGGSASPHARCCMWFEPVMPGSPSIRNLASIRMKLTLAHRFNPERRTFENTRHKPHPNQSARVERCVVSCSSKRADTFYEKYTRPANSPNERVESTRVRHVLPMDASERTHTHLVVFKRVPQSRKEMRTSSRTGAHGRSFVETRWKITVRGTNEHTEVIAWRQGNAPGEFEKQNVLGAEVFPRGEV